MNHPPPPSPLAPGSSLVGAKRPGFLSGVRALFAGFGFILGEPGLWPLAMVPVLVALALTGLLGWAAVTAIPAQVAALLGARADGFLGTALEILAAVLALIVAGLAGFALAQPLSGPALERIVRQVESRFGAPPWPPTSVVSDVLRSLQSVIVSFAFGLPILAVLFAISFVFAPAAIVTVPLKLAVAALLLAWDLCDYPLSLRGVPIGARVSFMKRNAAATLGFGFGLALIGLVPCLLLFALPAGVAGAARLVFEIEQAEGAARAR